MLDFMLDTVVHIGSPDQGDGEGNIAVEESGRAHFNQDSLSLSGGFHINPEAWPTYAHEPWAQNKEYG